MAWALALVLVLVLGVVLMLMLAPVLVLMLATLLVIVVLDAMAGQSPARSVLQCRRLPAEFLQLAAQHTHHRLRGPRVLLFRKTSRFPDVRRVFRAEGDEPGAATWRWMVIWTRLRWSCRF